ncbi:ElyC/SanA/YdcF family protein [Vreelandella titanicae]|uniref:ElyC/SanA/YdcF family protein n=1 Tax=Vreelandella titanicae TaxID=664683 RepID=UPI0016806BC2|nr:ElyC/SanA/YdcF family protein [Halomonas titanicae]QNU61659.1 YdcF family protein [Halomonas titanicae]
MYTLIKSLAAIFLMPMPLMAVTFAIGWLFRKLGLHRFGDSLIIMSMILLFLAAWAPVADSLLRPLESKYAALLTWPEEQEIKAVVVLGGGWQPNQPWSITGQLSDSSGLRLVEGLRLWLQNPEVPLLVSGNGTDSEMTMAHGYAEAAQSLGVPADRIVKLVSPKDTAEEAKAVQALLGKGAQVLLVTSASHMPRAMRYFELEGLSPVAAPTHYLAMQSESFGLAYWIPSARQLRKTERAIYELFGLLAIQWEHCS